MLFFLLAVLGYVPIMPGLFLIEIQYLNEVLGSLPYIEKRLTKQRYLEWIYEKQEYINVSDRLSSWMYPTFRLSTEQCSGLGVMLKLPWSDGNRFFWVEPSVYEIGAPLFLNTGCSFFVKDKFYRWSVGMGYRYLMNPHIRLGIYGYYDYTTKNQFSTMQLSYSSMVHCAPLNHPHTFSAGIEIFTPLGRLIGNIYTYRNSTSFIDQGDIKYAIDRGNFTFAIGVYYGQHFLRGTSHLRRENVAHIPQEIKNVSFDFREGGCGVALESKYKTGWKTYGIKYTHDKRNKHRLSWTMQWELFYPCSLRRGSQIHSYLVPTERYLASSQYNHIAVQSLWEKAVDKAREVHISKTKAEEIRTFRKIFAKRYGRSFELDDILKTLKAFGSAMDIKDTAVLLEGSPERLLGDVYLQFRDVNSKDFEDIFTQNNQLKKLYTARSVLDHITLGDLLHGEKLTSISFFEGNTQFNPNAQQLNIINEFAATTHYFTPFYANILKNWNNTSNVREYKGTVRSVVGIDYYVDSLSIRLALLGKIAKKVLRPEDISISQASIISMQQKLNEAIDSHLRWQCTAALCSDFSQTQRKAVFSVACLPLLSFEIKKEILQYVVEGFIDRVVIQSRSALLQQDLQLANEDEYSYENRLYRYSIDRLLSYLSNIKTGDDYRKYLAIPENPYGILF